MVNEGRQSVEGGRSACYSNDDSRPMELTVAREAAPISTRQRQHHPHPHPHARTPAPLASNPSLFGRANLIEANHDPGIAIRRAIDFTIHPLIHRKCRGPGPMLCGDVKISSGICSNAYRHCQPSLSSVCASDDRHALQDAAASVSSCCCRLLKQGRRPFSQRLFSLNLSLSKRSSVQSLVSFRSVCRNISL